MNDLSRQAEVISLGCRLNISESEDIRRLLAGERDVVVVNSCAVTSEAVRQTRQAIRRARRANPRARLLVTGCAADIEREQLASMPEVDGLIANQSKLDARAWNVPPPHLPVPRSPQRTRAFIGVQNGCDHSCTFCVIPQGRGPSRSVPIDEVLRLIERDLALGAPEIILTGVDLTSWGQDLPGCPRLGTLVKAVLDHFPELQRIRLSSLDGVEIDDELLDLIGHEKRIMPHLHLSLQHGHDLMLKRMKRRHSREDAFTLMQRLRAMRPDIALGADLIAGFPTETEHHHAANLSIVRDLEIVHGHIFPYSPRPGTPAARMPQLAKPEIKRRAAELRAAVSHVRADWLQRQIGRQHSVLAESDGCGYAENFARFALPPDVEPGAIVSITPTKIQEGLLQ